MRSSTCWAIRHIAFEDLATLAGPLIAEGYAIRYLDAGVQDLQPLEHAAGDDLLVVLGGPMGVYETDRYPWLQAEIDAIAGWLHKGRPVLGICLGAQLIARALGAAVYPGRNGKEIGWAPLTAAPGAQDPIAPLLAPHTALLHWHGDTFDLPPDTQLLASTDVYPHQVYTWGSQVIAFQCHPEFDHERLDEWLTGHAEELAAAGVDLAALRADSAEHGPQLKAQTAIWMQKWLKQINLS
ncbi:GMP synthase [glutamine-hydrolyzing] [Andreprevotia sp. IGB-42]|uniref:glutamine amidotransferase n=1 Tax=Andreprevotia sp. IGB-42 TaxID=2497473 RepID=UPI00135C739D|nr:glutamine amidotransferase [Andreprevotia sp. IGB-42]KAF0814160.1 GMP synthase [glutamine-hydrolyzing] [Andreprevotia sp. IGB-42]